jgi:hypothetical protein
MAGCIVRSRGVAAVVVGHNVPIGLLLRVVLLLLLLLLLLQRSWQLPLRPAVGCSHVLLPWWWPP